VTKQEKGKKAERKTAEKNRREKIQKIALVLNSDPQKNEKSPQKYTKTQQKKKNSGQNKKKTTPPRKGLNNFLNEKPKIDQPIPTTCFAPKQKSGHRQKSNKRRVRARERRGSSFLGGSSHPSFLLFTFFALRKKADDGERVFYS
jgi:hypothetical protein